MQTTLDFKPKSQIVPKSFPSKDNTWVIGLDIGYSAVKGMCPNKYFSFPSYARIIPDGRERMKKYSDTDIRYREGNEVWAVGSLAYDEVNPAEMVYSEEELYGRNRYFSTMFKVITRCGFALGLLANEYGSPENKKIAIQTGLPPKYKEADTPYIKAAMAGTHSFDIQIGERGWQRFNFTLEEDDIYVMPQPLGALVSVSIDANGKNLPTARNYFSSSLIVFDPGFGTLDDYFVVKGNVRGTGETFNNLGMHEVFLRTCKNIKDKYGTHLSVPEFINYLDTGKLYVRDKINRLKRTEVGFQEFLVQNSKDVCNEAIDKMVNVHDGFNNVDYIVATGGTYDAWGNLFNEAFAEMEGLAIIPGNINDPSLTNVFSNVRGYYLYLMNRLN